MIPHQGNPPSFIEADVAFVLVLLPLDSVGGVVHPPVTSGPWGQFDFTSSPCGRKP